MSPTLEQELVITRIFDAPRELVWQAWTDPEQSMRWWGPKDFTAPYCTIDLRVGGTWHSCMRSKEGQEFWGVCVFQEIDEPCRLAFKPYFSDAKGNVIDPVTKGFPADWPKESVVDITFEDLDGRTKLTLRQFGVSPAQAESVGAIIGWNQSFDKLADLLISN
jgi:uncharacterized protein YndB with AHSA1/START domain